jgi:hypothetical protein
MAYELSIYMICFTVLVCGKTPVTFSNPSPTVRNDMAMTHGNGHERPVGTVIRWQTRFLIMRCDLHGVNLSADFCHYANLSADHPSLRQHSAFASSFVDISPSANPQSLRQSLPQSGISVLIPGRVGIFVATAIHLFQATSA